MVDQNVIREYLLKVGVKYDEEGSRRATDSINALNATIRRFVETLATMYGIKAIIDTNKQLADLAFTAQRIGSTVPNLSNFARAMSVAGTSTGEALATAEKFGERLKTNEAFASWVEGYAGDIHKSNGELKDSVEIMDALNKGIRSSNLNIAVQKSALEYAGISWKASTSLLEGYYQSAIKEQARFDRIFSRDVESWGKQQQKFTYQIEMFNSKLRTMYEYTLNGPKMTEGLEHLNKWLEQHGPEIRRKIDDAFGNMTKTLEENVLPAIERSLPKIERNFERVAAQADKVATAMGGWPRALELALIAMFPKLSLLLSVSDAFDPEYMKEHDKRARRGKPTMEDRLIDTWWSARPKVHPEAEGPPIPENLRENKEATERNTTATNENTRAQKGVIDKIAEWLSRQTFSMWPKAVIDQVRDALGGSTGPGGAGGGGGATPGGGGGGGATPGGGGGGGTKGMYNAASAAALARKMGATEEEATRLGALVGGESSGNPGATRINAKEHSIGLWQINQNAWKKLGYTDEQLKNPEINAKAAIEVMRQQGLGAWYNTSHSAGYQSALAQAALGAADPDKYAYKPGQATGAHGFDPRVTSAMEGLKKAGINVISGYRSPEHNAAVGGAAQSRHMGIKGGAFDVAKADVARAKAWLNANGYGGDITNPLADDVNHFMLRFGEGKSRNWSTTNRTLDAVKNLKMDLSNMPMSTNIEDRRTGASKMIGDRIAGTNLANDRILKELLKPRHDDQLMFGSPLGHDSRVYNNQNNAKHVAVGPFNTNVNVASVPGGDVPGRSTIAFDTDRAMRKVAARVIKEVGSVIT